MDSPTKQHESCCKALPVPGTSGTYYLDKDSTTRTVPPANRVLFAGPGTYQVFCMIHPFMHATVTVT